MKAFLICIDPDFASVENYALLEKECDAVIGDEEEPCVLVLDNLALLAECYAMSKKIHCRRYRAHWNLFGANAPAMRNKRMIMDADHVVAFGPRLGCCALSNTPGIIALAKEAGKPIRYVNY